MRAFYLFFRRSLEILAKFLARVSRRHEVWCMTLLAAGAITLVLSQFKFHTLEAALFDFRVRNGWQAKPSRNIVLIRVNEETLKVLGEISPLSLRTHADFLEALELYQPRAIGYLPNLSRAAQFENMNQRSSQERRILGSFERFRDRSIPLILGTPFDVTGEVVAPYPLSTIPHAVALINKDGNIFAGDKTTRRALTHLGGRPSFHTLLAQEAGLYQTAVPLRGSYEIPEIGASYFYFRYHGDPAIGGKNSKDKESYDTISFEEILSKKVPRERLLGKVILIGTSVLQDSTDFAFTPYSSDPFSTSKLMIHANILDSISKNNGLYKMPNWATSLLTFVSAASITLWVLKSSPLAGVLASFTMIGGLWTLALILFGGFFDKPGIWIELAHPSLGVLASYYLAVPYRLIQEYRKRWEYQRKNEILLQVEELKTNFLSLVTHDLKTPVARIQGLAEVLLMKASLRLNERDQNTVHHIIKSTEELNRFISSILELAKIENSNLLPQIESKDVNQLIEKCADTFKASARAKNCKIELELEPLFPIKLDPSLVQKVLHNLVDNAIKYSAPGSTIVLFSQDKGSWVEVHVRDEGIGMTSTEVENLFQRFYRAKNDTTAKVGGSGLGLYLSKYFIEAISGELSVVSSVGRGSTFTIRLRSDLKKVNQPTSAGRDFPGLLQQKVHLNRNSTAQGDLV